MAGKGGEKRWLDKKPKKEALGPKIKSLRLMKGRDQKLGKYEGW